MALKGIKVLELSGLAPGPFCGMILSDFGASVTKIDRSFVNPIDVLADGKRKLAIDIKSLRGQEIVRKLSKISDVLIEPYRPGVMEKLNLGPNVLLEENPRLIYARLTGFGQTGPMAQRAGHDINYIALSGALSFLGSANEPPQPPVNLVADFAGGGLLCAFGICAALVECHRSGKGQVIDSSMTEGAAYVSSWLMRSQTLPIWPGARGTNILDGGSFFYGVYETSDAKFMSVGAIEPQFFAEFVRILELGDDCEQYDETNRREVERIFKTKTQQEWTTLFQDSDACVVPVMEFTNADQHPQNAARNTFVAKAKTGNVVVPQPAPKLSRTPATSSITHKQTDREVDYFQQSVDILKEIGLNANDVQELCTNGIINLPIDAKL